MIFLSHNYNDKPVVEQIAVKLKNVFGQDNVFYDSWSIQPGDGIIDKMNEGLLNCKYFFFFVSNNSLQSNMVKMEWQNAIFKAAQNAIKFIPIRLDDSEMPFLLTQSLYIDLYSQGLEVATRQIIDVINGNNTFNNPHAKFQNLIAIKRKEGNKIIIECRAQFFMEPITDFGFATTNSIDDIFFKVENEPVQSNEINKNVIYNGTKLDIVYLSVFHCTTPDIPFKADFSSKSNSNFDIVAVFHKKTQDKYEPIPMRII